MNKIVLYLNVFDYIKCSERFLIV